MVDKDYVALYRSKKDDRNIIKNCPFDKLYPRTKTRTYESPDDDWKGLNDKQSSSTRKNVDPLSTKARIKLNPDKFLLAIPRGGPNNQIYALREAVFIAIKLNRTIVVPKFFKHFTDSQATNHINSYLHPSHRIQVDYFCKFVSCITIDQFQEACGFKVDAIIQMRNYTVKDLTIFESYIRMPIPRDGEHMSQDIAIPKYKTLGRILTSEIKNIFHTNVRCMIYPYPLFNLNLNLPGKRSGVRFSQELTNVQNTPDVALMKSIIRHTSNPFYIEHLAKEYISSKFSGRPFISVHWRFEELDYMNRCRYDLSKAAGKKPTARIKFCEKTMAISGKDIAHSIEKKIFSIQNETNIRDVYIASPPSEREKIDNVSRVLLEEYGFNTLSSPDLDKYVRSMYGSCEELLKNFNDIISSTEMEICAVGKVFLSSPVSTWSLNVKHLRLTSGVKELLQQYDENLYN